jgi:hypothetical protein
MLWTAARDRILLEYFLPWSNYFEITAPRVVALRVVDRQGRTVSESVQRYGGSWPDAWAVGRDFIATVGRNEFLRIGDGDATSLTFQSSSRSAHAGDVRFGHGWLYDRQALTITPERLPPCRRDTARVDAHGRIWWLDRPKTHVLSSDDGQRWNRHALSTTYFEWCDGGAPGSDLATSGDTVAIGLWRADLTTDRGATWHDVPLPYRRVGAHRAHDGAPNCTAVEPMPDGRLVISYFNTLVAEDPTNTRFHRLDLPKHTLYTYAREGVLQAISSRPYGGVRVSYDGGDTWHPVRMGSLLHYLLPPPLPRDAEGPSPP